MKRRRCVRRSIVAPNLCFGLQIINTYEVAIQSVGRDSIPYTFATLQLPRHSSALDSWARCLCKLDSIPIAARIGVSGGCHGPTKACRSSSSIFERLCAKATNSVMISRGAPTECGDSPWAVKVTSVSCLEKSLVNGTVPLNVSRD